MSGIPGIVASYEAETLDESVGHGNVGMSVPLETQIRRLLDDGLDEDDVFDAMHDMADRRHANTRDLPREDGTWDEAIDGASARWELRLLPDGYNAGLPRGALVVRDRANSYPFLWSADICCVSRELDLEDGDLQEWDVWYRLPGDRRWRLPLGAEHVEGTPYDCAAYMADACHIDLTHEILVIDEPEPAEAGIDESDPDEPGPEAEADEAGHDEPGPAEAEICESEPDEPEPDDAERDDAPEEDDGTPVAEDAGAGHETAPDLAFVRSLPPTRVAIDAALMAHRDGLRTPLSDLFPIAEGIVGDDGMCRSLAFDDARIASRADRYGLTMYAMLVRTLADVMLIDLAG